MDDSMSGVTINFNWTHLVTITIQESSATENQATASFIIPISQQKATFGI